MVRSFFMNTRTPKTGPWLRHLARNTAATNSNCLFFVFVFVTFVTEKMQAICLFYGMINNTASKTEKLAFWGSRLLRWALGTTMIILSWRYAKEDYAWVLLAFGMLLIITGFFKPTRCLDDNCEV